MEKEKEKEAETVEKTAHLCDKHVDTNQYTILGNGWSSDCPSTGVVRKEQQVEKSRDFTIWDIKN